MDADQKPLESRTPWYMLNRRNLIIFALIWVGEPLLVLIFLAKVLHTGSKIYLFMIPSLVFGLVLVLYPRQVMRFVEDQDKKFQERPDKSIGPGFP